MRRCQGYLLFSLTWASEESVTWVRVERRLAWPPRRVDEESKTGVWIPWRATATSVSISRAETWAVSRGGRGRGSVRQAETWGRRPKNTT